MKRENYNVIGVMSGTSLDGLDLAHIYFAVNNGKWSYKVEEAATVPYNKHWIKRLKEAVDFNETDLEKLNIEYTLLLGNIISEFIEENSITNIDAVCSHGHTILHQPQKKITLQIGNMPELAALTGQKIVCNFRVEDVHMGGQGAPLVPIGDKLLFSEYYFCLNLGGFSNISFEINGKRTAFDICAVNTVLNHYANILGHEYDDRGLIAAMGALNPMLLEELNALGYYKLGYPKSLGFEFVKTIILPIIDKYDIPIEDKIATYTEHIAVQLASSIKSIHNANSLLITGGGVYNEFLINKLESLLQGIEIAIPDNKTIQFKEALIFGLLGVLRLREEVNVLASVTGSPADHCAGYIYNPK